MIFFQKDSNYVNDFVFRKIFFPLTLRFHIPKMNTEEYKFDDITPLPVTSDSKDIDDVVLCKIMYSEEFLTVFGYLKAFMKAKEHSKRALYVVNSAIDLVPAHYTVWNYRYDIVQELISNKNYEIKDELDWCSNLALNNEKNYQIWHYREMIIELAVKNYGDKHKYDLTEENRIIKEMLESDEKNYHVWTHKRYIVEYFNLFRDVNELEYIETLIFADVRNNSAWNFRHFIIFGDKSSSIGDEELEKEIEFTSRCISISITNPSSWNYMKALYRMVEPGSRLFNLIKDTVELYSDIANIQQALHDHKLSVPAIELLADMVGDLGDKQRQLKIFTLLGQELDPIRKNYWEYRIQRERST